MLDCQARITIPLYSSIVGKGRIRRRKAGAVIIKEFTKAKAANSVESIEFSSYPPRRLCVCLGNMLSDRCALAAGRGYHGLHGNHTQGRANLARLDLRTACEFTNADKNGRECYKYARKLPVFSTWIETTGVMTSSGEGPRWPGRRSGLECLAAAIDRVIRNRNPLCRYHHSPSGLPCSETGW